jgi:hypothetical protein
MKNRPGILRESDHNKLDAFLGEVLDEHKAGRLSKGDAIGDVMHVIAALDIGDQGGLSTWIEARKFIRGDGKK